MHVDTAHTNGLDVSEIYQTATNFDAQFAEILKTRNTFYGT